MEGGRDERRSGTHWLIITALGTVWVLDGLEVTIKGSVGPSLKSSIGFSTIQVAGSASIYIFGAISGALIWGYLTDRFGRRKLFMITLGNYMLGVAITALAGVWFGHSATFYWFAVGRFVTGFGIGGEYSAINSAIDEMIPARVRGFADLAINGSWWLGTAVGSGLGYVYLTTLPAGLGWRVAFATGGTLAIGILLLRLYVPESPRWLITHGHVDEADRIVEDIEAKVSDATGADLEEPDDEDAMELRARESVGFLTIGRTLFSLYPRRTVVGFSLMISQAFLYNSVFFTWGLVLTTYYGVGAKAIGLYLIPFAAANWAGPLILGPFFDRVGRRPMIVTSFATAGVLTAIMTWFFTQHQLGAISQTGALCAIFFFASAAASAGYLTVSETFPLEIRAMAIAFFYALATGIGGIIGPYAFGRLISTKSFWLLGLGFWATAALMIVAAGVHALWGVDAEQRSLEDIAQPLTVEEAEQRDDREDGGRSPGRADRGRADVPRRTGRRSWAPNPTTFSVPAHDRDVERERDLIVRALAEDGPASGRELQRRVRSHHWGPGRFSRALRRAEREGLARRERSRYVPTEAAERRLADAGLPGAGRREAADRSRAG